MRARWSPVALWVGVMCGVWGGAACGGDGGTAGPGDAAVMDVLLPDAGALDAVPVPDADSGRDGAGPEDVSATPEVTPDVGEVAGPDTVEPAETFDTMDAATELTGPDSSIDAEVVRVDAGPEVVQPTCITLAPGHTRHVVVSRPYSSTGGAATLWEVFPLLSDGTLGASRGTFDMGAAGRAFGGKVAFTADGALGVTVHDRGEVGVIAIDEDGGVEVVMPATDLGPYVDRVIVRGDDLYLLDSNWANNGGGVYHATLACDGTIGKVERLYPTKLVAGLVLVDTPGGVEHLVAAREAVTTTPGHLHRVAKVGETWTRLDGVDVFGDDEAILSALAVTPDQRYAVVGDNSAFSSSSNRVGVASLGPGGWGGPMSTKPALSPFNDPYDLVASPYNDAVLVVLGFANRVNVLSYAPSSATPFTNQGSPTYVVQAPQLPGDAVLVGGGHPDLVLVVENTALRRFRFNGDGTVSDLGRVIAGSGFLAIPGAIGVQP